MLHLVVSRGEGMRSYGSLGAYNQTRSNDGGSPSGYRTMTLSPLIQHGIVGGFTSVERGATCPGRPFNGQAVLVGHNADDRSCETRFEDATQVAAGKPWQVSVNHPQVDRLGGSKTQSLLGAGHQLESPANGLGYRV